MTPLSLCSLFLVMLTSRVSLGCFHQLKPLMTSSQWVQATDIFSYLQYDIGAGSDMDTINVYPRGKDLSSQKLLKCIKTYSSDNEVLVEVVNKARDGQSDNSTFQCLRFKSLSRDVLRLGKSMEKSSKKEVNCHTDDYSDNESVLMAKTSTPPETCLLHGTFQALLYNARGAKSLCVAIFRFQCNSQQVMVTFGAKCSPAVYKYYSNKPRHQRSFYLDCVGGWSVGENTKMIVLSKRDKPQSFWCLHYTKVNGSEDFLKAYLSFSGSCSDDAFLDEFVKDKESMYGHLARYFPSSHHVCSAGHNKKHCSSTGDMKCSETNECPRECQRCYNIPKTDVCSFSSSSYGRWEILDSNRRLSLDVAKSGVKTSANGEFFCNPEMEKTSGHAVVQYDKSVDCMPLYACVQLFVISPGVLNFYLRPSIIDEVSGQPLTCKKTDDIYEAYPFPEGETVTMINVDKIQDVPCDFGPAFQFSTTSDDCLISVGDCTGKCQTMEVSFDNETCGEERRGLTLAKEHRCKASLKFQDRIPGLLTYSEDLEKYSCWVISSSRVFVVEPDRCNSESVRKLFSDKYAAEKYDPLQAFIIPPLTTPSRGTLSYSLSFSAWVVVGIFFLNTFF